MPLYITNQPLPYTPCIWQSGTGKDPQSSAVKAFISPTRFMSDSFLAWDLKLTLKGGIYAGAYWDKAISTTDAKHYADQFVNQFMTGEGEEWYDNGGLSNVMRNTPEGQRLMRQISAEFRNQMFINQGDFTRIKLSRNIRPPSFGWKSSPTLKILVGGTQRLIVTLAAIVYNPQNCRWMSVINVEIRDDFGVTEGDITNASPSAKLGIGGLADMWVLQHRRGKKPFTSVFNFSFICYDNN